MLPARYHQLRDRTLAHVDRVFAEPVKLSFRNDGLPDPDRPAVEIEAVLRVAGSKEALPSGKSSDNDWRTKFSASPAELHIDRAKYPSIVFRVGDWVRALSRAGQPRFEVLAIQDRGETRLILSLGEK